MGKNDLIVGQFDRPQKLIQDQNAADRRRVILLAGPARK